MLARLICMLISTLSFSDFASAQSPWSVIEDFGGAIPLNKGWVGPLDYPAHALEKGLQGNVVVSFDINSTGRAENCVVETSSGISELDRVPCPLIERRARFKALERNGMAAATKGRFSVAFWLPK